MPSRLRKAWMGVFALFMTWASNPSAAADDDFQAWQQVVATKTINEDVSATLEVQPRFTEDASRLGQFLIRPSIGFRLSDHAVMSVGYAYVRTSPGQAAVTHEHRPWQQLSFPIASTQGVFTLSNRTRFEQRFRDDGDEIGLRLRQQLRLTVPIAGSQWLGVAWSEGFFNLNDTDWGARGGLDRWRNFVGINIRSVKV